MTTFLISVARSRIAITGLIAASIFCTAAIAYATIVSGASNTASSANLTVTQLALGKPASTTAGDVLIATIATKDGTGSSVTPPNGWTLILRTDNGTNIGVSSYWKVAGASEPSTYTWTIMPTANAQGGITVYTGVHPSNPIHASGGATGNSTTPLAPSITTAVANTEVITVFAVAPTATTFSTPTGMTEKYDASRAVSGPSLASHDVLQSSAGASGSKSSTRTPSASKNWVAQQISLRPPASCTGGTVTTAGGNTIHTFTSSGTLTCTAAGTADILLVAGGGGTSGTIVGSTGGGAGGGVLHTASHSITAQAYSVTVGAGGSRGADGISPGNNGGNSVLDGLTALGGGGGGASDEGAGAANSGQDGGSGGGSSQGASIGNGTTGQGNDGGSSIAVNCGGGGGGAGTPGQSCSGGDGGDGSSYSISGTSTIYGGGGGGTGGATDGAGGTGGGGGLFTDGTDGLGGGGGAGAAGGSGLVIISYPTP